MDKKELSDKLSTYAEQLKVFSSQSEEYLELRKRYSALFYDKSAYKGILLKTHLFSSEKDKTLAFSPIKAMEEASLTIFLPTPSPLSLFVYDEGNHYSENDRHNALCIKPVTYASPIKNYRLLLGAEGEISIIVSLENKDSEILNFKNSNFSFFLNVPLIVGGIIKNKEAGKEREKLEKLATANPTSTLGNIYAYVKENLEEVFSLSTKIKNFEKDLKAYSEYCSSKDLYYDSLYEAPDTFPLHTPNLYYSISEKAKEIFVEMSFTAKFGYYEILDESFPFILLFKKEEYQSYFSPHEEFYRKTELWRNGKERDVLFTFDTKDLLTLEEKIKEVSQPMEVASCIDRDTYSTIKNPWKSKMFQLSKAKTTVKLSLEKEEQSKLEKVVSKDLENNSKTVITSLEEFLLSSKLEKSLSERGKILKEWKKLVITCEQDFKEITSLLAEIYKKEIVLSEI